MADEAAPSRTALTLARTGIWKRLEPIWALALMGGLVYVAARSFLATDSTLTRVADVAGGVFGAATFGAMAFWSLTEAFGRTGEIRVDEESITLDSPEWFYSPIRVALRGVRLVSVDDADEKRKFHVQGRSEKASDTSAWLFRDGGKTALPVSRVNPLDENPNLAILFDPPVDVPGKKDLATLALHPRHYIDKRLRVVLARVTNARDATRAFRTLGLLRAPTTQDVAAVEPGPEEARRLRRGELWAYAGLALIVALYVVPLVWYMVRS